MHTAPTHLPLIRLFIYTNHILHNTQTANGNYKIHKEFNEANGIRRKRRLTLSNHSFQRHVSFCVFWSGKRWRIAQQPRQLGGAPLLARSVGGIAQVTVECQARRKPFWWSLTGAEGDPLRGSNFCLINTRQLSLLNVFI